MRASRVFLSVIFILSVVGTFSTDFAAAATPVKVGKYERGDRACVEAAANSDLLNSFIPGIGPINSRNTALFLDDCQDAIAAVEDEFKYAYEVAEESGIDPGEPTNFVHDWPQAGVIIQDFYSNSDGWGAIIWGGASHRTDPYFVSGKTLVEYKESVNARGISPGYPTGVEHDWDGVRIQDFAGGSWGDGGIIGGNVSPHGAWLVTGNHMKAYWANNGPVTLGNPKGWVYKNSEGNYQQDFEKGTIFERAGNTWLAYNDSAPAAAQETVPAELPPVGRQESPPPANTATCTDRGAPVVTSPLTFSPAEAWVGGEVSYSFTIRNDGCSPFAPVVLAIGGHSSNGIEDAYQSRDFVLAPGESRTITHTDVREIAGQFEYFIAFMDQEGDWHRVPGTGGTSQSVYQTVTDAPPAQAEPAQPTDVPAQTAPTTEPIVSSETTEVTPSPVQETQPQEPATSSNQDDSNIIEPVDGTGTVNTSSTSDPGTTTTTTSSSSETSDIALITRDPADGRLLTGACYELVNFSNQGCDENSDGQVTFADIPFGTYTVRQTVAPGGYSTINEYQITVGGTGAPSSDVPLGFVVRQAPQQNAPNTRHVSVVFLDTSTGQRMIPGGCVQLVGVSLMGCDEDLVDGQVDFLDVPAGGPYELSFSNLPSGYQVGTAGGPLTVTVDAGATSSTSTMVFVQLSGSGSSGRGTIAPVTTTTTVTSPQTTASSGSATLLITMRGCPEGFNPETDDFFANCTEPLDAPDASFLYHGGDGQGGMNIMWMDRQYDGAYIFNAGPNTMNVTLSGLAPVVRDGYTVVGADSVSGDQVTINLVNGETRQVYVFYYYLP